MLEAPGFVEDGRPVIGPVRPKPPSTSELTGVVTRRLAVGLQRKSLGRVACEISAERESSAWGCKLLDEEVERAPEETVEWAPIEYLKR